MLDRIFLFKRKNLGTSLYINGFNSASSDSVLETYLLWYNSPDGFLDEEDYSPITKDDFEFIDSFVPIDFYEESRDLHYQKKYQKRYLDQ